MLKLSQGSGSVLSSYSSTICRFRNWVAFCFSCYCDWEDHWHLAGRNNLCIKIFSQVHFLRKKKPLHTKKYTKKLKETQYQNSRMQIYDLVAKDELGWTSDRPSRLQPPGTSNQVPDSGLSQCSRTSTVGQYGWALCFCILESPILLRTYLLLSLSSECNVDSQITLSDQAPQKGAPIEGKHCSTTLR